ncbi:MAG: zinc ribbon domain-containing protein [Patescibacteria group bacterium]|jgi:hypothetical protein
MNNKKSKTGRSGFFAVKLTDEALSYQLENYNQLSGLKSMRGKASLAYSILYFLGWTQFIGQNLETSKGLGYALLAIGLAISVVIYKWTKTGVVIAFTVVLLNALVITLINPIQLLGALIALYILAYFVYPAYQVEKHRIITKSTNVVEQKNPIADAYCSKCGQKATNDALYCWSCGAKIISNKGKIKPPKSKKIKKLLWVIVILVILWLVIGLLSAAGVFSQDYEPTSTGAGIISPPKLPSPPALPQPPEAPKVSSS